MNFQVRHQLRLVRDSKAGGHALLVSLVFLTILTTVGIFALKNSGLEMKMNGNSMVGIQAFEAAEATRSLVIQLIGPHLLHRGWPESSGGSIDNDIFAHAIPEGLTLNIHPEDPWYDRPLQTSSNFNPLDFAVVDVRYRSNVASTGTPSYVLQGAASVKKLRVDINPGTHAAMNAGYEHMGMGTANSGSAMFFYIQARGEDPNNQAVSYTSSIYRYIINN